MKKIVLAVSGDVNFGAIQYSDIVKTEFNLKKRAPESVVELIDSIVYDGGYSTITGAALTEAYTNVHSGIFGGRSGTESFPNIDNFSILELEPLRLKINPFNSIHLMGEHYKYLKFEFRKKLKKS